MPIYDCSLWEYLKISAAQGRQISMTIRFRLFKKILSGLRAIQDGGFRHLDIKPGNVMLRTRDGTRNGIWNEQDLRIIDYGLGGRINQQTGLAGTPGFASPEQLVGQAHNRSDNYSFGRLMVMIFAEWQPAWNLLFQPITDAERQNINLDPALVDLFYVITRLVQVN